MTPPRERDVASRVDEDVNARSLEALQAEVPPEQRDNEDDA